MSPAGGRGVSRRRVLVRGRVQGVGFRYTLQREARSREVAGWACNRDDGAVEAVFEGAAEAVERMVELCRRGPRGARVEGVDETEEAPQGASGFDVR